MARVTLRQASRTCVLVSGTMGGADAVCQYLEGAQVWDEARSLRMGFVGLVLSGPISQAQHVLLERLFPGKAAHQIVKKVTGTAVMAPFVLSSNFALVGMLKGHSITQVVTKCKRDVWPTWVAGT